MGASGAQVVVYDAPFTGAGSFQALFNRMIDDGVTIISNSWAYCEDQTTLADVESIDSILGDCCGVRDHGAERIGRQRKHPSRRQSQHGSGAGRGRPMRQQWVAPRSSPVRAQSTPARVGGTASATSLPPGRGASG